MALLARGGNDEDVARLEEMAPQIAELVIAARPAVSAPVLPVLPPEPAKPAIPTYPADGEVFELTLDADAPENQPLEMVRRFGYNPEGWQWQYTSKKVLSGKQTRRFKLVAVGYCRDLKEVRQKLATHGEIPEGQWIMAFKAAYPQPDGKGPVGVADPSWVFPDGDVYFPYVGTDGGSRFRWADYARGDSWRWLVAVSVSNGSLETTGL